MLNISWIKIGKRNCNKNENFSVNSIFSLSIIKKKKKKKKSKQPLDYFWVKKKILDADTRILHAKEYSTNLIFWFVLYQLST